MRERDDVAKARRETDDGLARRARLDGGGHAVVVADGLVGLLAAEAERDGEGAADREALHDHGVERDTRDGVDRAEGGLVAEEEAERRAALGDGARLVVGDARDRCARKAEEGKEAVGGDDELGLGPEPVQVFGRRLTRSEEGEEREHCREEAVARSGPHGPEGTTLQLCFSLRTASR